MDKWIEYNIRMNQIPLRLDKKQRDKLGVTGTIEEIQNELTEVLTRLSDPNNPTCLNWFCEHMRHMRSDEYIFLIGFFERSDPRARQTYELYPRSDWFVRFFHRTDFINRASGRWKPW